MGYSIRKCYVSNFHFHSQVMSFSSPSLCGRCAPNDAETLKGIARSPQCKKISVILFKKFSKLGSVFKMFQLLSFLLFATSWSSWVFHHAKCYRSLSPKQPWWAKDPSEFPPENPASAQIHNSHCGCGFHYHELWFTECLGGDHSHDILANIYHESNSSWLFTHTKHEVQVSKHSN